VTGLRVLLVEDDALNQELVRVILGRSADPVLAGAELVMAGSLTQARAILAADVIDVVLLDMQLPDGSGLDLAAEIRRDGNRASRVMIALSGAKEQHEAAMTAGCVAALAKPYGADELRRQIVAHLERVNA
jgi:two-component system, OmpR family, KDP operon response regulator KdpE